MTACQTSVPSAITNFTLIHKSYCPCGAKNRNTGHPSNYNTDVCGLYNVRKYSFPDILFLQIFSANFQTISEKTGKFMALTSLVTFQ